MSFDDGLKKKQEGIKSKIQKGNMWRWNTARKVGQIKNEGIMTSSIYRLWKDSFHSFRNEEVT